MYRWAVIQSVYFGLATILAWYAPTEFINLATNERLEIEGTIVGQTLISTYFAMTTLCLFATTNRDVAMTLSGVLTVYYGSLLCYDDAFLRASLEEYYPQPKIHRFFIGLHFLGCFINGIVFLSFAVGWIE